MSNPTKHSSFNKKYLALPHQTLSLGSGFRDHTELMPLATAACPQAICKGPSLYRNPAMVPRALAKQNHSWQKIKQKIAPEDKNTAGEKFKESKQMKIIIG